MRKSILITLATIGVATIVAAAALVRGDPAKGSPFTTPVASKAQLEAATSAKVFFAHQSVGYNMMGAVAGVFDDAGVPAPKVVESHKAPSDPGIVHVKIGKNGDPVGKIREFDKIMRGGMAAKVDVAVLKLCYVDFKAGTDADAIFNEYRNTFSALSQDYPETKFIAATAPLTTERGPLGKLRALAGRGDSLGPEHNVVRERFNSLMRAEYSKPGELFDIAAVQSTSPTGKRVAGRYQGEFYYAMHKDYASDPGHLNAAGAATVTSAFASTVSMALAP